MFARTSWNTKSPRKRPSKSRRKYLPEIEGLETLQLMSVFGDIGGFIQGAYNDVVDVGEQAVSDVENFANGAIGEVTNGAEQAIGAIQNFGGQLLTTVANDVQMVQSTVTSSLTQIGTAVGNFFPQAAGAVTGAISQLGTAVAGNISQITGQVSSDLQEFVSEAGPDAEIADGYLSTAINTASSTLASSFEQFGNDLETTFTSPAVEAGLSYSLDGLMILGGVALMASSEFDGPVGAIGGATLIGAGISGIEYNVENTNSDGTVNGNWSWSSYGENVGIGGAVGFVSGGLGVIGAAAGGGIVVGAASGAASGVFAQFLDNAADGSALDTNLGAAAGLGAVAGGFFGALSSSSNEDTGAFTADASGDLVGGVESSLGNVAMDGTDGAAGLGQNLDELAMDAGVNLNQLPTAIPLPDGDPLTAIPLPDGEPQFAIPVPDEAPAPVTEALPGFSSAGAKLALKTVLKDSLRTFVAPQASGLAPGALSELQSLLGVSSGSSASDSPPSAVQFATDLTTYFNAASAPAPNGYLQSVTSVPLPFGGGTALVGIGGDNAVYVNEQVPGLGSTGWVDLGGYATSISVTTNGANGLPVIFAIGSDNGVHVNDQSANGSWSGWTWFGASTGFKEITATVSSVNTPEVFAIGFDNAVYTEMGNPAGGWSGWTDLGGSVTQIAATENPHYGTDVYTIGAYDQVFVNQSSNGGWSGWTDLGGTVTQIAAGTTSNDDPEVFAIGGGNTVWVQSELNDTTWTGWTELGGYAKSIVTQPNVFNTVYAIGASNNIEVDRYVLAGSESSRPSGWSGFETVASGYKEVTVAGSQVYGLGPNNHVYAINPGSAPTDVVGYVATMALGGNATDVGIGSDNSVYVDEQNPDGSWTGETDLGGDMLSVTATKTSNGETAVFGIGSNEEGYIDEQNDYGIWTGWLPLGGNVVHYQSIVATTGPTGEPEVFVIGDDNAVWVDEQTSNNVFDQTGFFSLGGQVKSISVAQDPSGGAVVAAIGLNNYAWVNEQTAEGNFTGWAFTGGIVQSLTVAQAPDGGVALVAIGEDNAVWVDEQSYTASEADYGTIDGSWTGFVRLGGDFTSVEAVNSGFGTLDIIALDGSGNEWADFQTTGNTWSGFAIIASPSTTTS